MCCVLVCVSSFRDKTKDKQDGKARRRAAGEARRKMVKFMDEDDKDQESWTVVQRGKAPGVLNSQVCTYMYTH